MARKITLLLSILFIFTQIIASSNNLYEIRVSKVQAQALPDWFQDYEDGFDGGEPFQLSGSIHDTACGNLSTRNFGGSRALYAVTDTAICTSNPIRLYRSYHAADEFPLPVLITFWFYVDAPSWQMAAGDRFSQLTAKEHSGAGADIERIFTTHVRSDGTIDCGHCDMSFRSTQVTTPLRSWNLQSAYIENINEQTHVTLWVDSQEAVRGIVNNHWYEGFWRDGHIGMYADREGNSGPFSMYNDNLKVFTVTDINQAVAIIGQELGGAPVDIPNPSPTWAPVPTPTPLPGSPTITPFPTGIVFPPSFVDIDCICGDYVDYSCGEPKCLLSERWRHKDCIPDNCEIEDICVFEKQCIPTPTPFPKETPSPGDPGGDQEIYCDASGNPTITNTGSLYTAIGCIPIEDTNAFAAFILTWGMGIGGGLAIILIVYAGFMITTSQGNIERLQSGRQLLTAAIAGLILIIFSAFTLRLIGVDLFGIPGFGQ